MRHVAQSWSCPDLGARLTELMTQAGVSKFWVHKILGDTLSFLLDQNLGGDEAGAADLSSHHKRFQNLPERANDNTAHFSAYFTTCWAGQRWLSRHDVI